MNFQPMDYLNGLNLDFEVSPNISEHSADLNVFAQNEFFDFDVFAKDTAELTKQLQTTYRAPESIPNSHELQFQLQVQQPQEPAVASVYSSPTESTIASKFETHYAPIDVRSVSQSPLEVPAVHEDKRKRNTAASARFRIKKKQKEQEMEARTKQLQETVGNLEKKLMTLEMENKALKNLINKQNEQKNFDLLEKIKMRSTQASFQFTQ
jgi:hypothetical protein